MSSRLVPFGRSWYVPVHDVPGHRAVGRRPRAPGRPGRDAGGRRGRGRGRRAAALGHGRAHRGHRQRRRLLRGPRALARVAGERRGAAADRRGAVWDRRARPVPLAAGRRGARGVVVGRVPRRRRDRAGRGRRPCVAITASAGSSLAAAASATVLQRVASQRAVTHTQALAGAYASGLALWAAISGDVDLAAVLATAPDEAARAVAEAERWAAVTDVSSAPAAAVVVGGGTAWAAALELALMLKEITRIPAEGVETREGATSAMFGLAPGHLMVSLDAAGDPLGDEAVRLCAAAGATTLRLPGAATPADARLALMTALPGSAALAAVLAEAVGHDVDRPTWTDSYYDTARSAT